MVTIGELSERSGVPVSKIRYYESEGLLHAIRSRGGNRIFTRADNRRLGFIMIAQSFGYSLAEIQAIMSKLPENRTPTQSDWEKISNGFKKDIGTRIRRLELMREKLDGCIGCGCLSMKNCPLYNPEDEAAARGQGAIFVLQGS